MKQVVMMGASQKKRIGEFEVTYFDPSKYIKKSELFDTKFLTMKNLDDCWRNGHLGLKKLLAALAHLLEDKDALIMSWVNPLPPEWVNRHLGHIRKVFCCMDDPHKAYERTLNSIWAYDGVVYWSPGYDDYHSSHEILSLWGAKNIFWWPASWNYDFLTDQFKEKVELSFGRRRKEMCYVGQLYGSKYDRLVSLKKHFGNKFSIYGRWPYKGMVGFIAPIKKRKFMPHRVRSISNIERTSLYLDTKIGFNMHLSDRPRESGNMRMFETAFHGLMMLCDKGSKDCHETIFLADQEAVYYDSISDAIDLAEYYLNHDEKRIQIARAGFIRACKEYDPEKNLISLLEWATSLNYDGLKSS